MHGAEVLAMREIVLHPCSLQTAAYLAKLIKTKTQTQIRTHAYSVFHRRHKGDDGDGGSRGNTPSRKSSSSRKRSSSRSRKRSSKSKQSRSGSCSRQRSWEVPTWCAVAPSKSGGAPTGAPARPHATRCALPSRAHVTYSTMSQRGGQRPPHRRCWSLTQQLQ